MDEFNFDYDVLTLAIGVLIPFVTAIVKKAGSPDWQSGLITVTVTALYAALDELTAGGVDTFDVETFAATFLSVWTTALLSWLGLTSDATNKVMGRTPGVVGTGDKSNHLEGTCV